MNVKPCPGCCSMQMLVDTPMREDGDKGEFDRQWEWWEKEWPRQSSPDFGTLCMMPMIERANVRKLLGLGFKLVGRYRTNENHGGRYFVGVFLRQPERDMKK